MKVYYVGNDYMGCYYVRCFLPMLVNGWKGTHYGLTKDKRKPEKIMTQEMLDSDVIVFHRANTNWHHRVGMILKEQGKKIVFDNDDTFLLDRTHAFLSLDERGFEENKVKLNNVVNNFIINSDLVTCSTEFLRLEYLKLNPNVAVLPNYVNPSDWPDNPQRNYGDKVRIGLVGSTAYHQDFHEIEDLLRELDKSDKVQLVLFGLWKDQKREQNPLVMKVHKKEYEFWDSLKNKEHVPWCDMAYYFDTLDQLRLDLMLIPREDNYFNRCKSNLKFLEASMLEIPVIASDLKYGPYSELDGEIGIKVKTSKQWHDSVWGLVNNPGKRRLMGAMANKYVIDNYNIENNAYKWRDVYKTLCQEKS